MTKISLEELVRLCSRALRAVGVSHDAAMTTARALVYADASGIQSHGVSRLPQYIRHIRTGRVRADASPSVAHTHGTAVLTIDADNGLAFPACDLAVTRGIEVARLAGIAFVGVRRSHHFGVASYHLLPAAEHGLVGIAFSNSPAAMPAWMGKQAVFGTNPVALVFPRRSEHPIVIDVSLSAVARGRLMTAARRGEAIPEGWAADKNGDPTRDPNVGLEGLMLPIGGLKGAVLAMAVELLCSAVVGAGMAGDNPSFFEESNKPVNIGHAFLLVDPGKLAGREAYLEGVESLILQIMAEPAVRLPGQRADECRERASRLGVEVDDAQLRELNALAQAPQGGN